MCRLLVCVVMAFLAATGSASAETRLALVVGNASYKHTSPLANPANDAILVEQSLTKAGFKVTKVINASRDEMLQSMLDFNRSLRQAGTVGLFYYAGHAIQINGLNYLVPIDADIRNEDEIKIHTIPVSEFLQTLDQVGLDSSRMMVVILDACRNNPFARGWRAPRRSEWVAQA